MSRKRPLLERLNPFSPLYRILFLLAKSVIKMEKELAAVHAALDSQGALIDQLVAQKSASDQASLDAIQAKVAANNAKIVAALTPAVPPAS